MRIAAAAAAVLLAAMPAGCARRFEVWHRVAPGQTAFRIAEAYGVDLIDLLETNDIPDPSLVRAGHVLRIPGASGPVEIPPEPERRGDYGPVERRHFRMPVAGKLSSGFGGRTGRFHQGVDILAPEGTEVAAAAAGIVLYTGDGLRGYGRVVILDHGEGVTTLYGHLRDSRVESGDVVGPGKAIGTVGRTGNATTSHLHFEVRLGNEPLDPLKFIRSAEEDR